MKTLSEVKKEYADERGVPEDVFTSSGWDVICERYAKEFAKAKLQEAAESIITEIEKLESKVEGTSDAAIGIQDYLDVVKGRVYFIIDTLIE